MSFTTRSRTTRGSSTGGSHRCSSSYGPIDVSRCSVRVACFTRQSVTNLCEKGSALSTTVNVINRTRARALVAVPATVAAVVVGCTAAGPDGPEKIVFATSRTTIQVSGASPTKTTLDFSNLLNNVTGTQVRGHRLA